MPGFSNASNLKIVQQTGQDQNSVMSQKATTDLATTKQSKNLYFQNVSVSNWESNSDTGFETWTYKAAITCTGVTSTMRPRVDFNLTQAESGNYCSFAVSGSGTVTIYSKANTAITIPLITAEVVE